MGARPSSFKQGGGGFLNNVIATITGYKWFVGEPSIMSSGKRAGGMFTPLSLEVSFLEDGKEAVSKRLLVGEATEYGDVSDDDMTLDTSDDKNIRANSEAGIFISTLLAPLNGEAGFPEDALDDDPDSANYEPIIGTRVLLVQVENPKKKPQVSKKNGKSYPGTDLKVQAVVSLPGKAAKAGGAAKAGKASKAAAVTVDDTAIAAIKRYVAAGPLTKKKVLMKVLTDTEFAGKTELRTAVTAWITNADNLGTIDGIDFDAANKETLSIEE